MNNTAFTCVCGYWIVDNKHGDEKYKLWFNNTLRINCPYIFFSDKDGIELIKNYRRELPTYYIEMNIPDFYTYKYKDIMKTHPIHCPSKELNLIWNEKLFLLQKAKDINPFHSEFFMWIDAGISIYRHVSPPDTLFPNPNKLQTLPKDKFIYSQSDAYEPLYVREDTYYHHVSGTFIMHQDSIDNFVELYKIYLDKLLSFQNIWTEQVILTHIYKDNPSLFFKLCDGYGEIINYIR